ncbi:MAG: hypothetical protein ABI970_24440 [Chloroflexota bacterium]
MHTLLLRLTFPLTVLVIVLVALMQLIPRLLPPTQIIPIVTFKSPVILLVDANRHIAVARRPNPSVIFDAVVSPDQQRIAFSMSDGHQIDIYAGDLYANDYQRVTHTALGSDNPAWSPDSRQIAFVGFEPNNQRGIYTAAVDGTASEQTILKAGNYGSPAWSPDGHQLTFTASHYQGLPDLFVVDSSCRLRCDREMIQLTNELVVDTVPLWSPDGSHIAFLSDRSGDYEIYTLDMDCLQPDQAQCRFQTPRRLRLNRPIVPSMMLWSLNGSEIYFRAWDAIANQPGLYAIKSDCPSLVGGCQARMVYNLADTTQINRGLTGAP